jgi:LmbE family N-acetylglucosaminyl deacetylase
MLDRQTEITYHPRELLSLDNVNRVLCVAPHPDDEVFGCGGLLAAWAKRGCKVHTLILTCGQLGVAESPHGNAQQIGSTRREESVRAAQALGTPEPEFLELPDRGLRYNEALVDAIAQALHRHAPQVLLLPSLSEPHPDHQAAALAGLAAAQLLVGSGAGGAAAHLCTVLFYECGAPLHANIHFPFDEVAELKWQAVRCFTSQLGLEAYESHAQAMAALRAFGLRPPCRHAESFFKVDLQAVRDRGALAALPQWPWVRERLALANDPAQLPLVSVLVRSMNRTCLPEALASVALQTYPHLELVVVNASGGSHRPLDFLPSGLSARLVQPPNAAPCSRAEAANLALGAAQGSLALFLDDDDLLQPHHLQRLVKVLQEHPRAVGAYAGVRVETSDGLHLRDYDFPWSRARLEGVNFLPIHAVLFRLDFVRKRGLQFDRSLPVLEDWHFWLQLTQDAALVHCPGISALYRQGLGDSALGNPDHPNHWKAWHRRVLLQWASGASAEAVVDTLAWHAMALDAGVTQAAGLAAENHDALVRLRQAHAESVKQVEDLQAKLSKAHVDSVKQIQGLQEELSQARSFATASEADRLAVQHRLEVFSHESQAALAAKELELQRYAAQAQLQHAALNAELHASAAEHARLLQSKEEELQKFSLQAQASLQARDREQQALKESMAGQVAVLEQECLQLQADLAQRNAELSQVYSSRSWRWTSVFRRQRST